jgi:Lipopolysaccharide-assembly
MLAMTCAMSGCGYALAGRASSLPVHIRTVGIPVLENRTNVSRLETILTDRIRTEFIGRNRRYRVVNDETGAEAVLKGEVIGFSLQTAGLNAQQLSSRYLVTVVLKVSFIDVTKNEVLWSNDALTFRDEYQFAAAGVSAATLIDQERSTVDRIATDASRSIVTAILEQF